MKTKLRLTLAFVLLMNIVSCSQAQSETPETTASQTEVTSSGETDTRQPYIEKNDLGGARFTIFAPDWGLYSNYFFADEQSGDAMNDAIWEREMLTEDYLNVDIQYIKEGTINDTRAALSSMVMSGDDTYQLALTHCITPTAELITDGLILDWNTIPTVDLSREYWNQSCNENLSLYGKQYYAVSDYMIADPNAVFFNKELIESYQLENPYDLVRQNEWTLDKLNEMASVVTIDLNGDSVFNENDQYGFYGSETWMYASFFYSSGIHFTEKQDDGSLALSLNNERTYSLFEKLDQLINRSGSTYKPADTTLKLDMSSGKLLFQIEALNRLNLYRDCDVDFGIVPYPLLDDTQTAYETNDWSGLMCIPATAGDTSMIGMVCEMLAYYSEDTTIPAYYDLLLGEKFARDADSKEMLELIFDNVIYDAGMNYFGHSGTMYDLFYSISNLLLKEGSSDFASYYNARETSSQALIEDMLEKVSD